MKIKFLIIRLSSIGDIVLTSPLVRMIKNQVEGAEIHFLVKKNFLPVIAHNPHIDHIHCFEGNLSETINSLRLQNLDYVIDLHHNLRSYRISRALNIQTYRFKKLNLKKFLLVHFKLDWLPNKHIVDRYIETCQFLHLKNDGLGLEFFYPKEAEVSVDSLPSIFIDGYFAFVIGGQHFTKKLPNELIIQIIQRINYPVILIGGKEDAENAEAISKAIGLNSKNFCGKINLYASASIVKHAQLVITHDTGFMHIAAAFEKKIISIWGNTVPQLGMYPYRAHPQSFQSEVKGLACRPCSKIGFQSCPKKHFDCMQKQDIDTIVYQARKILHLNKVTY